MEEGQDQMPTQLSCSSRRISSVICNVPLAKALGHSINKALSCSHVSAAKGDDVWSIFNNSLNAAIRDIEEDPKGDLFKRFIRYGSHHPDDPKSMTSDGRTVLSDPECGEVVEFIHSHMINRFKGELAELLALEPCITLLGQLCENKVLSRKTQFVWGDKIKEQCVPETRNKERWDKGADGLFLDKETSRINIYGIVEVKSMNLGAKKILKQIEHHIARLKYGIWLAGKSYSPEAVMCNPEKVARIIVRPSTWKVDREWKWGKGDHGGRKMIFPEPTDPPVDTQIKPLNGNIWEITLAWSGEALEQAAYEMTYGYMADVGKHVFVKGNMPKGWEDLTPEEAGYNAIKMNLYYLPLRSLTARQDRLAIKLYNIYSFGYPLAVDHKEMLWPEDLDKM